jgi:hypothetical protein
MIFYSLYNKKSIKLFLYTRQSDRTKRNNGLNSSSQLKQEILSVFETDVSDRYVRKVRFAARNFKLIWHFGV